MLNLCLNISKICHYFIQKKYAFISSISKNIQGMTFLRLFYIGHQGECDIMHTNGKSSR